MGTRIKKQISILVSLSLIIGLFYQLVLVKPVKAADAAVEVELHQISRPNEVETSIAEGLGELVVQTVSNTGETVTAYSKITIKERGWMWIDNTVNTTYPGNGSSSTVYFNSMLTKTVMPNYKVRDKLGDCLYAYYLDPGTYFIESVLSSYSIGVDLPLKQAVYGYFLPSSQVISAEVETQTNSAQLHCTSVMSDAAYYWAKDTSTVDKIGNTKDFYTNVSVVSDIEVDSNGEYSICAISQLSEWKNYPVDIHVTVDGIAGSQATTSPTKSPTVVPTSQPTETESPFPAPTESGSSYIWCGETTGWGGANSYPSSANHEQGAGDNNFYYIDLTNMAFSVGYGCGLELMNPYNPDFTGAENEMSQFVQTMKNPCIKVTLKRGGTASAWNWDAELSFPSGVDVALPQGYLNTGYFALFGNDDVITAVEIYDAGQSGGQVTVTPVPTQTKKPEETAGPDETEDPVETVQPNQTDRPIITTNPGNTDDPGSVNHVTPTKKPISGNAGSTVKKKVTKPKKVKGLSLNRWGKRKVHVMWNWDDEADGYQIQYAFNRSFTKQKKNKNVNWLKDSILLKNLKQKKTCYVRVRAYKSSNGKKIYGKWSNIKKCKIK